MSADRLSRLEPHQLRPEQAELYESITSGPRAGGPFPLTDATGALHGPFGLMLHVPALGVPLQNLGVAIRYATSISARMREIAVLLVAAAAQSEYEWYAHARVGVAMGITTDELDALARGEFSSSDVGEQAATELCQLLLDDRDIGDDRYADFRAILGEQAMLELVVLVGYYRTLASMLRVYRVQPPTDEETSELPSLHSRWRAASFSTPGSAPAS